MRRSLGALLFTVLTMGVAFITLLGLLGRGDLGLLSTLLAQTPVDLIVTLLLQIVVVLGAVTVLTGSLNLVLIHVGRLRNRRTVLSSFALLASFVLVIIVSLRPPDDAARLAVQDLQVTLELAFAALLLFSLVYGVVTITRRRMRWSSFLFAFIVIVVLIGSLPIAGFAPVTRVVEWLNAVPVDAGTRALLLGIALATVIAGVRVLVGQDRSMRE